MNPPLLSSVHLIDAIIGLLVLEIAALSIYRALRGSGMLPDELAAFLGAGLAMLVALRVIAGKGPFAVFAVAMLASLGLHIWHVAQRWQRRHHRRH